MEKNEGLQTYHYSHTKNSGIESSLGIFGFALISIVILTSLLTMDFFSSRDYSKPSSISMSNVTNNSFTLSWETNKASKGYLVFGTNPENLNLQVFDNKDFTNRGLDFETTIHAVTLTNLKPATYYYYKML